MKGILEALLFEVSIWNGVIHRDPFSVHFVEPCSDFKCIGVDIVGHRLFFHRLLVVIIVIILMSCLLDSVVHKLFNYCRMFIGQ